MSPKVYWGFPDTYPPKLSRLNQAGGRDLILKNAVGVGVYF
jgi:hypothetical protein